MFARCVRCLPDVLFCACSVTENTSNVLVIIFQSFLMLLSFCIHVVIIQYTHSNTMRYIMLREQIFYTVHNVYYKYYTQIFRYIVDVSNSL